VIKVEGNPLHPINTGKLCARGQASVQGIYNPDRFPVPLARGRGGKLMPVSWEQGEKILVDALSSAKAKGCGDKVVILSDLVTGKVYT
jgi:anaerobic selenocysteine-containing dehydrogenase